MRVFCPLLAGLKGKHAHAVRKPAWAFITAIMQQLRLFETIDKDKITLDLFQAYFDARKNKRNTINALAFEKHFEANIFELCEEIINKQYQPKPSICFVVDKPVKREIFAADFRDRVVHHFIYNYISPVFEKTFINDSYSLPHWQRHSLRHKTDRPFYTLMLAKLHHRLLYS